MTSFKKFVSNPIVAKISSVEEFNYVADLFNKNEMPDESGNPFRESDPCLVRVGFSYPIYMCVAASKKYIEQYHLPNYFEENKWTFINGFELVDEEPAIVKELHISCKDGQTVEAEYYEDGKQVDKGVVTCSEPMVIKEVYTDVYARTKYRLYGDHCQWNWTREMFE